MKACKTIVIEDGRFYAHVYDSSGELVASTAVSRPTARQAERDLALLEKILATSKGVDAGFSRTERLAAERVFRKRKRTDQGYLL